MKLLKLYKKNKLILVSKSLQVLKRLAAFL